MGAMVGPEAYMETRFQIHDAMAKSAKVIENVANEFKEQLGRHFGGLIDSYHMEEAETVIVSFGSVLGTIKDAVDVLRKDGQKIGVLKIRALRPFPANAIYDALKGAKQIFVIEKAVSLGMGGVVSNEVRSVFHGKAKRPKVAGCICGLGGRDITVETIHNILTDESINKTGDQFIGLKEELLNDEKKQKKEVAATNA